MRHATAVASVGGHRLEDVRPLRGCTRQELAIVERCATPAWLEAGAVVWRADDLAREAVVVLRGELEAHIGGLPLGTVRPGQALGVPLAVSGRGRWRFTLSAVEATDALVVSTRELQRLAFAVPGLLARLAEHSPVLFGVS